MQIPTYETFMRIAIDLGKYHISDNHFQLLETSVGQLERIGFIFVTINEPFREYSLCFLPQCQYIGLALDVSGKLPFACELPVTYLVCKTEHKVFLNT